MSNDARITALRYYSQSGRDIKSDLEALSANPTGVVVWMPQLVVLMKAADSRNPQQWQNLADNPEKPDGWYVHLLTGDLLLARRLACEIPKRHWACFQRGKRNPSPHRLYWQRMLTPRNKKK